MAHRRGNRDSSGVSERRRCLALVFRLWGVSCVLAWLIGLPFLRYWTKATGLGTLHFSLAYLSHFAALQALAAIPFAVAVALWPRRGLVFWALPLVTGLVLFFYHLDGIVFALYRFHFNGAVISLMTTPGVGDSLQFSAGQYLYCAGIIVGLTALLSLAARGFNWWIARRGLSLKHLGRHAARALGVLLAIMAAEKSLYAAADALDRRDVLVNARLLPFYQPTTGKTLARRLGFHVQREHRFDRSLNLRYPLRPLAPFPATNAWNIVWIAIEGWRTDAFNAEITPRMQRFAAQCLTGTRHYSSGNTTRFGIFGMFYGLHGFYWHPFLVERQGPVLFKALKGMGYDIRAMGSANFNNPEFRLTCFVDLAPEEIRDGFTGTSCDRDAAMAAAFHEFLEQRDSRQPFFCFMFFDAPHAYHFRARPGFTPPLPIEDVPFVSYQRLAHDPEERRKAHQRYQNAQAYVDFLVGGILDDLAVRQVLTNTIVMISGDHGEEFGESGYYGHNSAFDDWQTCTPFVFYYPGAPAGQIDKLISHADWLPTAMHLLGSRQSPADYCQGLDILSAERRDYVVSSSWSQAAIITAEGRLVFPFEAYRLATADIYDAQGRPIMERDAFLARYGFALREVLESTRTFKQ